MEANNIRINGKEVALCKIGGGIMFSKTMGYEELEYIKATGTQWLDTGVYAEFGQRYETYVKVDDNGDKYIFGYRDISVSNGRWGLGCSRNQAGFYVCNGNYGSPRVGLAVAQQWNMVTLTTSSSGAITFNMGSHTYTRNADFTSGYNLRKAPMQIFKFGGYGTVGVSACIGWLKIYNPQGDIVLHLVPVRRLADGVLGMLDLVTKTFYTNQGSGDFIAGPPTGTYY